MTTSILALAKLSKMEGSEVADGGSSRDKLPETIATLQSAAGTRVSSFKGGDFADLFESFAILGSAHGDVVSRLCEFFESEGAHARADLRTKTAVRMVSSLADVSGVDAMRPLLNAPLAVLKDVVCEPQKSQTREDPRPDVLVFGPKATQATSHSTAMR